ncbi:MAG TPA: GNAT family N-acetyltransferase [Actinomycetota bacterium]|nr:GNAT family N-acetyltransferase [Actinomycetota bacterium]
MDYRLVPFDRSNATTVLSWARTAEEREAWASIRGKADVSIFDRWHADDGVHPFAFLVGDRLLGYGEVWEDPDEHESELARLIVDPKMRGRGVGRRMVELLSERARALGYDDVWVRVVPSNDPAIKAYSAAGFVRTTPEDESSFNEGQPREYVWMRLES